MNIGIPQTILRSTLANRSITVARLTSRADKDKETGHLGARFASFEHLHSLCNTDTYVCEPRHYRGKTYIKGGDDKNAGLTSARSAPI